MDVPGRPQIHGITILLLSRGGTHREKQNGRRKGLKGEEQRDRKLTCTQGGLIVRIKMESLVSKHPKNKEQ